MHIIFLLHMPYAHHKDSTQVLIKDNSGYNTEIIGSTIHSDKPARLPRQRK